MPIDLTIWANDIREIFTDIPQTITLASSKVVSACVTSGDETDLLEEAGVTNARKLTALVIVADCDILPIANDLIVYDGQSYRVTGITKHDDGVAATVQAVGAWE
jgi:hypothetical protein